VGRSESPGGSRCAVGYNIIHTQLKFFWGSSFNNGTTQTARDLPLTGSRLAIVSIINLSKSPRFSSAESGVHFRRCYSPRAAVARPHSALYRRYSKYVFVTEGLEAALQAHFAVATSNGADASRAAVANTTVDGTSRGPVTTKNA
jgi:hypothetical protein